MLRVPTHREPTHPGEMLREKFLKPLGLSQRDLAERIDLPYQRVNELVNRRRGVTPATALRLAKVFGTTPGLGAVGPLSSPGGRGSYAPRDPPDPCSELNDEV